MSCPHGNPIGGCDTCDEVDAAFEAGKRSALAEPPVQQEPVLQDIEQYRLQMAGISTAAIGYWKEGDGIHPDYDTVALRDVAKLYAKYDELYRAQPAQQEPEYIQLRHKEEDGFSPWGQPLDPKYRHNKWAAGVEMRLLYTSPPAQRKPLTDEMKSRCPYAEANPSLRGAFYDGWLKAEAAHGIKGQP